MVHLLKSNHLHKIHMSPLKPKMDRLCDGVVLFLALIGVAIDTYVLTKKKMPAEQKKYKRKISTLFKILSHVLKNKDPLHITIVNKEEMLTRCISTLGSFARLGRHSADAAHWQCFSNHR